MDKVERKLHRVVFNSSASFSSLLWQICYFYLGVWLPLYQSVSKQSKVPSTSGGI